MIAERWEHGRPLRVLALDGGGIRGVFTAGVLAELEQAIGGRIAEHFDLIAGTSTGGILAIGLGLGVSPDRLVQMYVLEGESIFGRRDALSRLRNAVGSLLAFKHAQIGLRSALVDVLQDRRLGESDRRLVIPTFDALKGTACTFKTAHHPRTLHEYAMPAVEVALATSAAPTYLKAAVVSRRVGGSYIDGGLWANTPVIVGIVEAVHFLGARLDDVHVLSVGTTEEYTSYVAQGSSGKLGWSSRIADAMMAAQVSGAQAQARLLLGDRLVRINFQANRNEYPLDDARRDVAQRLAELGQSVARAHAVRASVEKRFLDAGPAAPFIPLRMP